MALAVRKLPLVVGNGIWERGFMKQLEVKFRKLGVWFYEVVWKSSSASFADKMEFCKFESRDKKKKQYFCSLLFGFVFGAIF